MDTLDHQPCPLCYKKTLVLTEEQVDIPYFGKTYVFSMNCSSCHYSFSDVEAEQKKEPSKYTIEIDSDKDMNIRVVKSSTALVSFPLLKMSMESGPTSHGFITNIEGLLDRFKKIIEDEKDDTDDEEVKKNAKNLLKKIWKIKLGDIKTKLVIEDQSGNSAIISEKAKKEILKK